MTDEKNPWEVIDYASKIHGAPSDWVCNAPEKHQDEGRMVNVEYPQKCLQHEPCNCVACVIGNRDNLYIGKPFATYLYTEEELVKLGYVGIYKRL